jgi:hypothetical protein
MPSRFPPIEQTTLAKTTSDTGMWQRNRGGLHPRFREASRSRASDSPLPGEDRSPNGPARRRILLAKVEAGEIEEKTLKQWLHPAVTRPEDRALFGLESKP